VYEALKGDQHKVDLGEAVTVNKKNYSWGKMVTVHQGASTTYPLHPEHQEKIRKLSDGDKTTFKDETGATVHAHRSGDTVHLKKPGSSNRTTAVAHSHFTEDVDIDAVLDEALDLLNSIDEKTLTPAEMKKREEVVKAIKRDDPKMDKSMAYAIATKTAKRVAEETEELEELSKGLLRKTGGRMLRKGLEGGPRADKHMKSANLASAKLYPDQYQKSPLKAKVNATNEEVEEVDESYQELMALKNNIARNEKKMKAIPGIHPEKKRLAIQIEKDTKRHKELFNKHMGRNESVEDLDESAKIAAHLIKRYGDNVRKSHVRSAANDFGVGYVALSHAVRKKLGVNRLEEEQIDEISAKKLSDYTAAATDARRHRDLPTKKLDNRYKGVMRAGDKMNKGFSKVHATEGTMPTADEPTEANKKTAQKVRDLLAKEKKPVKEEALDELSKGTMGRYINRAKDVIDTASYRQGHRDSRGDGGNNSVAKGIERKLSKRHKGIETAVKKLTREEVEAIDELSKKTLGSYVNKAALKIGDQGITAGLKIQNNEPADKNLKKMGNRQKGIATAVKKLTKEDIINNAIEKYVPEEIKYTPEERLLQRLEGLSEVHVNTLLGLFEALNKDNQTKMIETVESREGVNQLLNFALENRGE
jgi:superoxide dismutase